MGRRLRIGLVGHADPEGPRSWSGTYLSMVHALRDANAEVIVLPWRAPPARRRLSGRAGKAGHDWAAAGRLGAAVEAAVSEHRPDLVLAVAASTQVARARLRAPLIYSSDTTFQLNVELYPTFSGLSDAARRQGNRIERAAIKRADRLIYPSSWAAESAVATYGADPNRITLAPYGPNLPAPSGLVERTPGAPLRLLWIGMDWERKGGDVAVAVARELRQRGIDADLMCIGATPPAPLAQYVAHHRVVDRTEVTGVEELQAIFGQADLMLLPSRADCSPIVLSEASAFGLPAVVSDVGGIPEVVVDEQTGFVVPATADVTTWTDATERAIEPAVYARLAAEARAHHERVLNWETWADTVLAVAASLVESP